MIDRRTGPLGDRELQTRLKDLDHRLEEQDAADLDAVLRRAEGRRLFYRLIFLLGRLESPSYEPHGGLMSYREGWRGLAILLRDEIQAVCPELWIRMLQDRLVSWQAEQDERRKAQEIAS
jgi:hypothetical protein